MARLQAGLERSLKHPKGAGKQPAKRTTAKKAASSRQPKGR